MIDGLLRHFDLLAARRPDLEGMSQGFRSRHMFDNASQAVIIAGVLVFIAVTLLLIGRFSKIYEQRQATNSASGLFRELCRIHKLNRPSRRLLKRLATHWSLESPAMLFVEPELFATAKLPIEMQDDAPQIDALRRKLFDA